MDFAIVGLSRETIPFLRALSASQHRLVGCLASDAEVSQILEICPQARRLASAPELFNLPDLNVLIVDTDNPEILEATQQLAGYGVAIVLVPHAGQGIEFIYQLGLIRDEHPDQFRMYPLRLSRMHPLVQRLRDELAQDRLGRIHQLQLERAAIPAAPGQPALFKAAELDEAFLKDADLLKSIAGEFDLVTALRMGDETTGFAQGAVTLAGPRSISSQWTCRTTTSACEWKLTCGGAAGAIVLSGTDDPDQIRWESNLHGRHESFDQTFDCGNAALQELIEGFAAGHTIRWAEDLNRTFDLLEGTHRSLRRKRTVELYFDVPSERSNFKTQMTALGCMVLLLTLFTILMGLGVGMIATELKLPKFVMQSVRVLVFAPLFLFLILQVGIFFSRPTAKYSTSNNSQR